LEQVQEPTPETETTELLSILSETEDVLLLTEIFLNAESTVDQTTETQALKLMSDAQDHHTRDQLSIELAQNSLSAETLAVDTYGERVEMEHGDHLLLTTSGITTTVQALFAETFIMVLVQEPRPEEVATKNNSILKLVTEDVLLPTITSSNAESTVDQTKEISALKLMLDALELHGDHTTLELDLNTELPEKDGLREEAEVNGDHSPHTTSGITTTVPKSYAET